MAAAVQSSPLSAWDSAVWAAALPALVASWVNLGSVGLAATYAS